MELLQDPPDTAVKISPSRLACFQDCPKKYDYVYRQSLQLKTPVQRVAFDKGNYCHELLHVYYQMLQSGVEPGSEFALRSYHLLEFRMI